MKLRVQQLIQPFATASNAGVVEFDFEGLEFLEEGCHAIRALCSISFGRGHCATFRVVTVDAGVIVIADIRRSISQRILLSPLSPRVAIFPLAIFSLQRLALCQT